MERTVTILRDTVTTSWSADDICFLILNISCWSDILVLYVFSSTLPVLACYKNSVKRKGKIKEHLYLLCALFRFLPSRNHNLSVRNDGHVIISKKEKQKININQM